MEQTIKSHGLVSYSYIKILWIYYMQACVTWIIFNMNELVAQSFHNFQPLDMDGSHKYISTVTERGIRHSVIEQSIISRDF